MSCYIIVVWVAYLNTPTQPPGYDKTLFIYLAEIARILPPYQAIMNGALRPVTFGLQEGNPPFSMDPRREWVCPSILSTRFVGLTGVLPGPYISMLKAVWGVFPDP